MSESVSQASQLQEQSLPPGTRLEEFVIERILGSGGFGITYLAKDSRLGRQVVIKENLPVQFCWRESSSLTVRPRHSQGEDAESFAWSLENFEKEAAMLASLDHPGIVRVLRSFEAFGTAFFVMPFVEGKPLDAEIRDRRDRGSDFSEEEIVGLLRRMLDALEYLHARGIYHRDIKPGNILITHEGVPVLIDFGSARQRLSERSLTVIESPGYTPFEQLQSRGKIGPWSDLYALGGTLYKAITGETSPKATDRIMEDPIVPLAQRADLRGNYSLKLLESIDRSMAPRVNDRLRSSAEWRDWVWGGAVESESTESLISAGQRGRGVELPELEATESTRELTPKSLRSHEAESPLRTPLPKPCSTINNIGSSDAKSTTAQARKKSNNTVVIASGAVVGLSVVWVAVGIYAVLKSVGQSHDRDDALSAPESFAAKRHEVLYVAGDEESQDNLGSYAVPDVSAAPPVLVAPTNSTQGSELNGLEHSAIGPPLDWAATQASTEIPDLVEAAVILPQIPRFIRVVDPALDADVPRLNFGTQKEAIEEVRKAAKAGNVNAMGNLAICLETGTEVKKNEPEAVVWYRKAAEKGDPDAMFNLGRCYSYGIGVTKDETESVVWYRKAAEKGSVRGMRGLATGLLIGLGVEQNIPEANLWLQRAVEAERR